ncbi:ABC transporter, permease protein [Moorella glycerini]|uniref:Hemin transport system permease protein HmuU n=1 Tax=Neomoorella stamsii TaxID=1266720 RepID=A0A9X7J3R2_9FIRM|nr:MULTISPECIES: iron ABC transporter permease [Moorella]PRR72763.1 Hemin transport system permease protein HmuU [Moorella stamsii]CEP68108.1 ABC transporter, permease protein [Moorella glycerini]
MRQVVMENIPESYLKYTQRKVFIICLLILLTVLLGVYAINAGSAELSPAQVLLTLLGKAEGRLNIIIWNIRLPRVLAAVTAGVGLSMAGCVMQNLLRNPLASPFTLGISQGAAFGAAVAIIALGAGSTHSTSADAVIINNPYLVTISAFVGAMATTLVVLFLAQVRGVTPEAMVLAGVALGSLFSAATIILQFFASDVQVASIVFWTFGDIGRASWRDLEIMAALTFAALLYFIANRWNYNALDGGEETAKGLGVDVERIRLTGMFVASLVTAVTVSFLGIIGFIGLVGPHMMRRVLGGDHRFLIPASSVMGGLLLLASDTLARTVVSPVVLPVGAITSFMGAPLFLYLLSRGYGKR